MLLSIQKELTKRLSTPKIPKIYTLLNVITIEHECDLIIDVQCNGLVLHGVLMDRGKH
jgi:hypothetical protein